MFVCWTLLIVQGVGLDALETRLASALKPSFQAAEVLAVQEAAFKLAESAVPLKDDEWLRLQKLILDPRRRHRVSRVRHELALCALAAQAPGARAEIARSWDALTVSTGHRQRLGTFPTNEGFLPADLAPKSIRRVLLATDAQLEQQRKAKDNLEIAKIRDDDQAARNFDFSKVTPKQIEEMAKGDVKRKARTLEMLRQGKIITAKDFDAAGLVMQHGSSWEDYTLAHELTLCALALGNKDATWLAAASYDRLLVSGGHSQRFATQYSADYGMAFKLDAVDTEGIGDGVRKAMNCPTLEQARTRKWD